MKLKLFFAGLMSAASLAAAAESCLGGGSKVSTSEVQKALSGILGNAKVVSVSNAPISGLYEVVIESGGRKVPIYVDCNLKYLVNGEIIDINKKVSLTRERLQHCNHKQTQKKKKSLLRF
jgi:Disulfide bond isomerase protein N-terminus.